MPEELLRCLDDQRGCPPSTPLRASNVSPECSYIDPALAFLRYGYAVAIDNHHLMACTGCGYMAVLSADSHQARETAIKTLVFI
jgi:hypothetical protein